MTEDEFLIAQSMGLLSMDWEYLASTRLRQVREYYDKWPMVEVIFHLNPNPATDDTIRLSVLIREALTEQEKNCRKEDIRQWEKETLRKRGFTVWDRNDDKMYQTWKTWEDHYLQELERLEKEDHSIYGMPLSPDMPLWLEMGDMVKLFRRNGVYIDPESDTDEVMRSLQNLVESDSTGIMKVFLQELLDIDKLDQGMELWRTLLRERKDSKRKEIQEKIEEARNFQAERIRDMKKSNIRYRNDILKREAEYGGFDRKKSTVERTIHHTFRLNRLKDATKLTERMIEHRAIIPDNEMIARYGILRFNAPFRDMLRVGGAFKDFNEFFQEEFDLRQIEPDEPDIDDRVRRMFS